MSRALVKASGVLAVLLLLPGCLVNQFTRMPQPLPRHPKTEQKSFEFHDPFGNTELAPSTESRPRGMDLPRTESRRAMEQRAAHGGTRPRSWTVPMLPLLPTPRSPVPQVVPE